MSKPSQFTLERRVKDLEESTRENNYEIGKISGEFELFGTKLTQFSNTHNQTHLEYITVANTLDTLEKKFNRLEKEFNQEFMDLADAIINVEEGIPINDNLKNPNRYKIPPARPTSPKPTSPKPTLPAPSLTESESESLAGGSRKKRKVRTRRRKVKKVNKKNSKKKGSLKKKSNKKNNVN